MSKGSATRGALSAWLTAVLALSAVAATGYRLSLAVARFDSDAIESPLALPVARQITEGPGGLYGPYGGRNPFVLIHAPLYYRAAALLAFPISRAGLDPVAAALVAGRSLSLLSLLAVLALVDRLARLGGAPRRAGLWAALLVAALPILGGLPVTVRADMAGVALQTLGVFLVLSAIAARLRDAPTAGFAAFGAALCVKQHLFMAPALSAVLLLAFGAALCVKQHLFMAPALSAVLLLAFGAPSRRVARGGALALAVVVVVYGADGLITGGRTFQAAVFVAGAVGGVRPSDWPRFFVVALEVAHWRFGTTALLTAAGLAVVAARPGKGRRAFAVAGTVVLVATLAAYAAGGRWGWGEVAGGLVVMPVLILMCALTEPRRFLGDRVDAALWLYWLGEVALSFYLFKSSTGSWTNYALQTEILASILTARALARAFDLSPTPWSLLTVAMAALVVLYIVWVNVSDDDHRRRRDRVAVELVLRSVEQRPRDFFFVGRPDLNRVHGRADLVYDDWLYPVFESVGLAERRSTWLRRALDSGSVRYAVTSSPGDRIEGLDQTLPELGFFPSRRIGPFFVWEQSARRE